MSSDEREVTYEHIKSKLDQQRRSGRLIDMPKRFYEDAQDYLEELREEYETAHARDPGAKEVRILFDELFRAREALNDLFDVRAKRLLSHSLTKSTDVDLKQLTTEERELFEAVRTQVGDTREKVLERAQRGGEHVLVRVLEGVAPFTAADLRIYDVEAEDIVALPQQTARLLVDRGKAVLMDA